MGLQNMAAHIAMEAAANSMGGPFPTPIPARRACPTHCPYSFTPYSLPPSVRSLSIAGLCCVPLHPTEKSSAWWLPLASSGLMHGNIIQFPSALLCGFLFGYVTLEYSCCLHAHSCPQQFGSRSDKLAAIYGRGHRRCCQSGCFFLWSCCTSALCHQVLALCALLPRKPHRKRDTVALCHNASDSAAPHLSGSADRIEHHTNLKSLLFLTIPQNHTSMCGFGYLSFLALAHCAQTE